MIYTILFISNVHKTWISVRENMPVGLHITFQVYIVGFDSYKQITAVIMHKI